MEQKITVKHEVGVVIPRLTNPASPEDVKRNKQYIDGQGVVRKGTLRTDRVESDFLTIKKSTLQFSDYNGTLGDVISDFHTPGLLGFSIRAKDEYEPNTIVSAVLRRNDDESPYWEAKRFVAHNYFDEDTMAVPAHPATPDDGYKNVIVPLDGYVGDLICSLERNAGVAGNINSFHAFDADGNDLGVLVYDSDENSKIYVRDGGGNVVRSGRIMTIPEGAATLRFNWNWKFLSSEYTELMVTHGDTIGATYVPYGDGWETITDLDADAVTMSGGYDYFYDMSVQAGE